MVNSSEWEEILRPTASYIQTSDEAFRDVLHKALDEELPVEEESLDYTRQLTPEEIAELTRQAAAFEWRVCRNFNRRIIKIISRDTVGRNIYSE